MTAPTDLPATVAAVLDQISPTPELHTALDPMVTVTVHTLATLAGTTHLKAARLETLREVERKVVEAHPQIAPELIRAALIVGRDRTLGADDPDLPLLGARVRYRPTPSPLTHALLAKAALADHLERALITWLEASPDRLNTAATHARVALLLIILRGGITEWASLKNLLDQPLRLWVSDGLGESLESSEEVPWLSLPPLAKLTLASFVARYPDTTTLGGALGRKATGTRKGQDTADVGGTEPIEDPEGLANLAEGKDREDAGDTEAIVATVDVTNAKVNRRTKASKVYTDDEDAMDVLATLLAEVMPKPPTVRQLRAAVRARVRRDVPDWLVRLMDGSINDAVVTTATRRRLMLDATAVGGALNAEKLGERPHAMAALPMQCSFLPRPSASQSFVATLIKDIKGCKFNHHVADVLARALPEAPCVIGALLVALAQHWITCGDPVRPTSVARYLSALRRVPAASSLLVPFRRDAHGALSADPLAWSQMLRTAASPALSSDLTTPRELIRLHVFATGLFPMLRDVEAGLLRDLRELAGSPQKRTTLMTDREMERACADLAQRAPHARHEQLLVEVAYATAARRDELAQARLSNLVERPDGGLLLTIRRHGSHRPKTKYSRRDLPLHRLLGVATLARLRQHAQVLRSLNLAPDRVFLFGDLARPEEPPPDATFDRIAGAMRHITGDPRMTFHSLRHCGIGWAFLRLLSRELPLLRSPPFPGMDAAGWTDERCHALLETLCPEHHQAPPGYLPRDWLRGLARLAGHGPPDTLLKHYQHLRPLFQWAVLDRYFPVEWPLHVLDRLADIHPRKRQRLIAQWRADGEKNEGTGMIAERLWKEQQRPLLEAWRADLLGSPDGAVAPSLPSHPPASLPTALVPMIFQLKKAGYSTAEIVATMEVEPCALATVEAALRTKVVGGRYAPPLEPVHYFVRRLDRDDFYVMAQRLDALPLEPQVAHAWRMAFQVHGRWAWPSSACVRDAVHHLFKALPEDGVLILECQPLPARPEGTAADALAALVATIHSTCRDRLIQVLLKAADTPKWRHRPTYPDATCWFYLRVGKRDQTLHSRKVAHQPDQTTELNERGIGYSGAVNAWLLRQDLRDVKWQLTRRHPDYDVLRGAGGGDAAVTTDEPA